jgi:copper oxidase (laccase) domain-containing protein
LEQESFQICFEAITLVQLSDIADQCNLSIMSRAFTVEPETDLYPSPIYRALQDSRSIGAAYTGKGTALQNQYFSFHRPSVEDPTDTAKHFRANFSRHESFDPRRVTLPNGAWPHSGHAIKAEAYRWVTNPRSNTIMPVTKTNQPVTYDALATRSPNYVLGVQGADCPAIFLYDPRARVIGLAHAGWKPVVRGVVENIINVMVELGARPQNILAHISPGAGDRYNTFKWDDMMEPHVQEVFNEAGRSDLLQDRTIRYQITADDMAKLRDAIGRDIKEGTSFKLSFLILRELQQCGIRGSSIFCNSESSIVDQYPGTDPTHPMPFKYHSYRREYPNHGLGMSVLFLKPESQ